MSMYRIYDAPTDGTTGQDCGTFDFASLPARIQAAIEADPTAESWTLPALSGGDQGVELDDLETVVTRDV